MSAPSYKGSYLNSVVQLSIKYPNVLTESGFPLSPTTTTHQLLLLYRNRRTASDGAVPNIVVTTPHFLQELKLLMKELRDISCVCNQ